MEDETKLFYDLTAKETADRWYKEQVLMPTIQDFVSLLPENPKILDLGCGPGHESMRLASAGAEVIGIDFSYKCIKIARERCHSCQFEVMNFYELDGRFGKFDGIVAYASLIHVKPSDLPNVLKRVAEVLKEEGYFETIVQDGVRTRESWPVVKGKKLKRIIYPYNKVNLIFYCSKYGLTFVKEGYIDHSLIEQGWRCYIFQKRK
jgi:2-polyprenyl-3-methyl-5-hydroxy-6-metoxy-1,4-benzoquinol methylase